MVTPEALAKAMAIIQERGSAAIPDNFVRTAPTYEGRKRRGSMPRRPLRNPQTVAFLQMLGLPYNLEPPPDPLAGTHPALCNFCPSALNYFADVERTAITYANEQ